MFCKKCGNQLDEGAAFCPKCGTQQNSEAIAVTTANTAVAGTESREQLIVKMESSLDVMTAMKRIENDIDSLDEQIALHEDKVGNGRRNIIAASGALMMGYGLIVTIPLAFHLQRKHKKQLETLVPQKTSKQAELETLKNDASLLWLPYDYRDCTKFAMMYGYIRNMRANSLKEAINLLETEMHQARVELYSAIAAENAAEAASASKGAAGAASAAAFFSLFR